MQQTHQAGHGPKHIPPCIGSITEEDQKLPPSKQNAHGRNDKRKNIARTAQQCHEVIQRSMHSLMQTLHRNDEAYQQQLLLTQSQ